jgi:intracellular septation protein A
VSEPIKAQSRFVEQFGGVPGLIDSGLPVVVFVVVNAVQGLNWAIAAALAAGVVVFAFRLARRERVQFAISGLLGVGVAVFFAWRLGRAEGFFIPGIAMNAAYFAAFAISLLVRRPLVGVLWTYLESGDQAAWRAEPRLRQAYVQATFLWGLMYGAKVLVQGVLFVHHEPGWLAVAKLAMGYPLFALVLAATVWLVRRARAQVALDSAT